MKIQPFYHLIQSFCQISANKFVRISKAIIINANKLLSNEMPNVTKSQATNIIAKCAIQCRGGIEMKNGGKNTRHASVVQIQNAMNNPKNNPKNNLKKQLQAAEENQLELMRMFTNEDIKEKPLYKKLRN